MCVKVDTSILDGVVVEIAGVIESKTYKTITSGYLFELVVKTAKGMFGCSKIVKSENFENAKSLLRKGNRVEACGELVNTHGSIVMRLTQFIAIQSKKQQLHFNLTDQRVVEQVEVIKNKKVAEAA